MPNPREGIKLASEKSFAVIIVDWMLLGLDVTNLAEEIDKRSPNSGMVMISGHPSVGYDDPSLRIDQEPPLPMSGYDEPLG
jgi:DNA-binding NtrC family response regulator